MRLFCKCEPSVLFYNASGFIISAYSLILKYNDITSLADVTFRIVASMYVQFRYSGRNPMWFAVFWRIFVRFCGFRTPLMPPSNIFHEDTRPSHDILILMFCTSLGQCKVN